MKFQVIFASWLLLIQPTLAIRCYYCSSIDCENQVLMRECPYIYTHCTAAVIDYSIRNLTLQTCALFKTCTQHLKEAFGRKLMMCYTCDKDYCNPFPENPYYYNASEKDRKHFIACCYFITFFFNILILK